MPPKKPLMYVSGPMSNIPEFNFPAFKAAAVDLRKRGYHVISPAELDEKEGVEPDPKGKVGSAKDYAGFLARDIQIIAERGVEIIACLDGWENSGGARTEVQAARAFGCKVVRYHGPDTELEPIPDVAFAAAERAVSREARVRNAATGGEKCTKPARMGLLPWNELKDVAELYAFGAQKYDDHNWRRGFDWSLSIDALGRHFAAWVEGEELDEETQCSHLTSVVFHALALMHFQKHFPELDNRPNTKLAEEREA